MGSIKECCRSLLRINIDPMSAKREDFIKCRIFPTTEGCYETVETEAAGTGSEWPDFKQFAEPIKGVGRSATVGVRDLQHLIKHKPERREVVSNVLMALTNDYELRAGLVGLWLISLDRYSFEFFSKCMGLGRAMNLDEWLEKYSEIFDYVIKAGHIRCKCGKELNNASSTLKKWKTLKGRNMDDADWEAERRDTSPEYTARMAPVGRNCDWSVNLYERLLKEEIAKVAYEIVDSCWSKDKRGISEWWKDRVNHMPSGSSSLRKIIKELTTDDERIGSNDRPNKKTISEFLPQGVIETIITKVKPVCLARCSTKHEWGLKNRAIKAVEDCATFVSSYASSRLEQGWDSEDIAVRQTPNDLARWALSSDYAEKMYGLDASWVCLDYSDYNKDHPKWVLKWLNLLIARRWMNKYKHVGSKYLMERALCAEWTASSHDNSWVVVNQEEERVWSSLCSGSRDTTRDNTALHKAYSRTISRICSFVDKGYSRPKNAFYSGDDEDVLFNDWISACLYLNMHSICGHHLNWLKQLVGRTSHEFLQHDVQVDGSITRPLLPALAQFCSGNWYKRNTTNPLDHIPNLTTNAQELVRRGMDINVARCITGRLLDRLVNATESKLEWWDYRNAASTRSYWLWKDTGTFKKAPTIESDIIKPRQQDPALASQDAVELAYKNIKLTDKECGQYKNILKSESYKPLYSSMAGRMIRNKALELLPLRYNTKRYCCLTHKNITSDMGNRVLNQVPQQMKQLLKKHGGSGKRMTAMEALAAAGINGSLVKVIGGTDEALSRMPNKMKSNLTWPNKMDKTIDDIDLNRENGQEWVNLAAPTLTGLIKEAMYCLYIVRE